MKKIKKTDKSIHDIRQNFWILASIQSGSIGLWGLILGWQLSKSYPPEIVMGSVCIGNIFLWLIGIGVISMSSKNRTNSIENINKVLGKPSAIVSALFLILAFLSWYVFQLKVATSSINSIFQLDSITHNTFSIRTGAAIGLVGALLAIGGLKVIKWIAVICLPILIIYQLVALIISENNVIILKNFGISFSAIILIIIYLLPGTINLPTFFRHSRSLADSYFALTLMAFFYTFFQFSSIWLNIDNSSFLIFSNFVDLKLLFKIFICSFVVLVTISNITVNIYFASASWEALVPKFVGSKEYAIIGLVGAAAYTFIQITYPMQVLINLANYYIANLGIILILTFLLDIILKKQSKIIIRRIGNATWLISCIAATILEINKNKESYIILSSTGLSILFFISAIFIEESIWSLKKIITKK
ncbi:MAG: hypothetical protein KR126chlam4_01057 [Candidatus Anoxychlamydiales bacterium]|nr:hypothetical protein [Candidatus Anoxychlamydiales bacterium]